MALVDAVHIETLDDSPLPAIEEAYTAQRPIPLTPGKHRLTISFCHKDMRWTLCSAESASLEVEVHAGEAYLVSYGICREPASLSWDAPNSRWWKFEMPSAYALSNCIGYLRPAGRHSPHVERSVRMKSGLKRTYIAVEQTHGPYDLGSLSVISVHSI